MTINFKHWQKNLAETLQVEVKQVEVAVPAVTEEIQMTEQTKVKLTYSQFVEQLNKKAAKIKVHTGEEDGRCVTEEDNIEEERGDEHGWDVKAPKEKPQATSRKVAGRAYGGAAQKDDDDEDDKPASAEKRGRGRPKGSTSGARTAGAAKKSYGGLHIHSLSLPNRNK